MESLIRNSLKKIFDLNIYYNISVNYSNNILLINHPGYGGIKDSVYNINDIVSIIGRFVRLIKENGPCNVPPTNSPTGGKTIINNRKIA